MSMTPTTEEAKTKGQVARDNFPERRGDWMQTYTGRHFWPLDPRQDDVAIEDIAHALSLLCRYGGHCLRFYSVAEHSVHLARWVLEPGDGSAWERRILALWLLLHDGGEAYLSDMVRPLKRHMPEYRQAEADVQCAVYERFCLIPSSEPAEVKALDNRILMDERAQVMRPTGDQWNFGGATEPLGITLQFWSPEQAEREFLATFSAITSQPVTIPSTPAPATPPGVPLADGSQVIAHLGPHFHAQPRPRDALTDPNWSAWSQPHDIYTTDPALCADGRALVGALSREAVQAWQQAATSGVPDSVRAQAKRWAETIRNSQRQNGKKDWISLHDTEANEITKLLDALSTHPAAQSDDDAERCIACDKPLKAGDRVLPDAEGGTIHAACCGPERESYTKGYGKPLGPNDPVPQGYVYEVENADGPVAGARRMAEGCCSAVSPCSQQQRDPYSLCAICQKANGLTDQIRAGAPVCNGDPAGQSVGRGAEDQRPLRMRLADTILNGVRMGQEGAFSNLNKTLDDVLALFTPVRTRTGGEGVEIDWAMVPVDDDTVDHADSRLPLAMIDAGHDAYVRVQDDLKNYVAGETPDWDAGMAAVAVYRAMIAARPAAPEAQGAWIQTPERFVIAVKEFLADWHAGDFSLPKLAEQDAESIEAALEDWAARLPAPPSSGQEG